MIEEVEDERTSRLPPDFDSKAYRTHHTDVRGLTDAELIRHYRTTGRSEGRNASTIRSRKTFVELVSTASTLLEIGPFANPQCRGAKVKYFDVLPDAELRERAKIHGLNPKNCPHIDFVSAEGDLTVVPDHFEGVLSCHVIEHQPDLIRHLQSVSRILNPGGFYFLAIPDKRYCFDHFIDASSIAEVVAAHASGRRVHDVLGVIEHRAMTTHNDPARHWAGDHGQPSYKATPAVIREAAEIALRNPGKYIDVHAWQFTPGSFAETMQSLFDLKLSPLRLARVYPTVSGSGEFYAVLRKTPQENQPVRIALPADFDATQYLLANPDVARAGVDAAGHYLSFGIREGRKLRP